MSKYERSCKIASPPRPSENIAFEVDSSKTEEFLHSVENNKDRLNQALERAAKHKCKAEETNNKLLSCPFCGETKELEMIVSKDYPIRFKIKCESCGVTSKECKTPKSAREEWSKRVNN